MTKKKLVSTACVIGLALSVLIVATLDEKLSPTARGWLGQVERAADSTNYAFLFASGIEAPINDSLEPDSDAALGEVTAFGKALVAINKITEGGVASNETTLPIEEFLDRNRARGRDDKGVVKARYRVFVGMTNYVTTVAPLPYDMILPFGYIENGNDLVINEAMNLANLGQADKALNGLLADTRNLRKHLAVSDEFLHKLIVANLIAKNLDAITHISSNFDVSPPDALPLLTTAERSFRKPIIREFASLHWQVMQDKANPHWLSRGGSTPTWIVSLLYKPNAPLNEAAETFQRAIDLSEMGPQEYALAEKLPKKSGYEASMNRIFVLDEKIAQVNQIVAEESTPQVAVTK